MIVFEKNPTIKTAPGILDRIGAALSGDVDPDAMMPDIPGILIIDSKGKKRPCSDYRQSVLIWHQMLLQFVKRLHASLPDKIADAVAEKAAQIIRRASESWNMTGPLVAPGTVSPEVVLKLENEVNALILVDIACDPYDAQVFNVTTLKIGASELIPQGQILTPASDLAGLTLGVWQTDGAEYNDVSPEFGTSYASESNKPITITAKFAHKRPFGPLAFDAHPTLSFLCLANRRPKNCLMPENIANIFEGMKVCKI